MVTLETLRASAAPHRYPRHILSGCKTALVLFAAGFHGRQDSVWMAEAGLRTTCVDTDEAKLTEMARVYPQGWEFVVDDVFAYASDCDRTWDVVSLDPFTNQMQECANLLPLWCHRAEQAVVLGVHGDTDVHAPHGWRVVEQVPRSSFGGGVFWVVLEREEESE
jgi:hypothetical protein